MLAEAKLMPCEVERENYHRMLSEVVPYINEEIGCFFLQQDRKNLNEKAYNEMLTLIGDRTYDFLNKIESESKAFMANFCYL